MRKQLAMLLCENMDEEGSMQAAGCIDAGHFPPCSGGGHAGMADIEVSYSLLAVPVNEEQRRGGGHQRHACEDDQQK